MTGYANAAADGSGTDDGGGGGTRGATGGATGGGTGSSAGNGTSAATATVTVEARSVNGRFLDLALRLPDELRGLEPALRELLTAAFRRGKVELRLTTSRETDGSQTHSTLPWVARITHREAGNSNRREMTSPVLGRDPEVSRHAASAPQ